MTRVLAALVVAGAAVAVEAAGQDSNPLFRGDSERVEISTPSGPVVGARVSTPHATLVTHTASRSPRDEWLSLSVDITPEPGEHIYAQGAVGYQPVKLTVTPARGIRLRGAARYPKAELYNFRALNEIVPAYGETFRVTQDVQQPTAPANRAQPLVIEGTLEYQACSETLCFEAVKVPVSWSVDVNRPGRQSGPARRAR